VGKLAKIGLDPQVWGIDGRGNGVLVPLRPPVYLHPMSDTEKTRVRRKGKDGRYGTVEGYRKLKKSSRRERPPAGLPQADRTVVPQGRKPSRRGLPYPLGATVLADGINFAVHSRHATDVFLVLFDKPDGPFTDVLRMPGRTGSVRHIFVEGLREGQLYGLRARGQFNPARGLRFNENKLLIDPYARAFAGRFDGSGNRLLAYDSMAPEKDTTLDNRDDADGVVKCIAYSRPFDWGDETRPGLTLSELIIYEVHVKGYTAHESSGVKHPGTYRGFVEKIPHLKRLGINAVELLPVHAKFPEDNLREKGLSNYWGYNTYGFFAPEPGYGSGDHPGCEVEEFKTLVKELHRAGIEVILDVVFNHSCEGNELGPTLSFKGLDNPSYYHLTGDAAQPARYYRNFTGTGNALDAGRPAMMRLIMDSLRYWVGEMHVDGFRFDLATGLGRGPWKGFNPLAPLFQAVAQDPALAGIKFIAEPWDLEAYEIGNFPEGWGEWNGKFRDCARRLVKGDAGQLNEIGWRLTGSADVFATQGREADASINFITCHDGFTMNDLVSFNEKHNDANGEENRDGSNDNLSWNCGFEGETEDELIKALRHRQARNFFALLLFSQGTPMISHGDEFLRTQKGNNNAYCQDNPLAWMDWTLAERNAGMVDFVRRAIAMRKQLPLLMGKRFLTGVDTDRNEVPDITWFGPEGKGVDWNNPEARAFAWQLDGYEDEEAPVAEGGIREGGLCYFIFNAGGEEKDFRLPALKSGHAWKRVADTSLPFGEDFKAPRDECVLANPVSYRAKPRSCVVLALRKIKA
jgi:isoamylase